MASPLRETPARPLDLETGSNSSPGPEKKKSEESNPPDYAKTTASIGREEGGEEINYNTLTWW